MSGNQAVLTGPHPGLLHWLSSHGVDFELHEHTTTYTARETARADRVSVTQFAKSVGIVTDDGRRALVVIDAADHVDLLRAARVMDARKARLMDERELEAACPGCDVGAAPAVGELFALPMFVDVALRDVAVLTFPAGSHCYTVHVDRKAWEKALAVTYASLAERRLPVEPAWMRS